MTAIGQGTVRLKAYHNNQKHSILLKDVLHIPTAHSNLISSIQLVLPWSSLVHVGLSHKSSPVQTVRTATDRPYLVIRNEGDYMAHQLHSLHQGTNALHTTICNHIINTACRR
jgi:hypothetical protein